MRVNSLTALLSLGAAATLAAMNAQAASIAIDSITGALNASITPANGPASSRQSTDTAATVDDSVGVGSAGNDNAGANATYSVNAQTGLFSGSTRIGVVSANPGDIGAASVNVGLTFTTDGTISYALTGTLPPSAGNCCYSDLNLVQVGATGPAIFNQGGLTINPPVNTSGTLGPGTYTLDFYNSLSSNSGTEAGNFSLALSGGTISVSPVPLPAAAWLMLSGLGGLGVMARKRKPA